MVKVMFNEIDLKDFYMFRKRVYFSFYEDDMIHYRAAKSADIANLNTVYHNDNTAVQTVSGVFIESNSIRELTRGEYYNELKQQIKEYCNYELMERLSSKCKKQ